MMSQLLNRPRQIKVQCIARGASLKKKKRRRKEKEKKKKKDTFVICSQQNFKFLKPLCQ